MGKPNLSIAFSNNNLTKDIQNIDGVAAMIGTAQQTVNQGKVFTINNLNEAVQAGITQSSEPHAYRQIKDFYSELGGNQLLYVLLCDNSVTMEQMLDVTDATKAVKLINAGAGSIAYLGVWKTPQFGYTSAAGYLDSDVAAAVNASKNFCLAQNVKLNFLRVLIEGRVNDESSNNIYAPNTAGNGYVGVVIGNTTNDKGAAIGLALGRKVKYAAHIKLGKVLNGALIANEIYFGTKKLSDNNLTTSGIAEIAANAIVTVTNLGSDDDNVDVIYTDINGGQRSLGNYTKLSTDVTTDNVATGLAAAINTATPTNGGFTATVSGSVVTIIPPSGLGATINGAGISTNISAGAKMFLTSSNNFTGGVTGVAAVTGARASSTTTISSTGALNIGDVLPIGLMPAGSGGGSVSVIVNYTVVSGDNGSPSTLATNITAAINASTSTNGGYTATAIGSSITLLAPLNLGATINGRNWIILGSTLSTSGQIFSGGATAVTAVTAVRATGTIAINSVGTNGNVVNAIYTPISGVAKVIGSYTKTANETTATQIATALKNAINGATSANGGFTAISSGATVTISAPVGSGAGVNNSALTATVVAGAEISTACNDFAGGTDAIQAGTMVSDIFHNKGFITFLTYPNKSGFYFGIDNMATDDDFRILAHGAVIDACAKVVTAVYLDQLESEVDTNANGTIKEIDAVHLEDRIKQQVSTTLAERISGFDAVVDRTINIVNTSKVAVTMKVLPKGYTTYIVVDLGLTAGN